MRLFLLALSRLNAGGHAEFEEGELVRLLARVDETTGELRTPNRSSVWRAMAKLKQDDFVLSQSSFRCVQIHGLLAQQGMGSSVCGYCRAKGPQGS